ncbi:hypothetical protein CRENBAI_017172 [Crenichthys baileyi]|uniref:Uncharacterized protein n=1 Tax=Crenichthys baileyi TaxID=28760 RepID=A0AAV9RQT1_9TELE
MNGGRGPTGLKPTDRAPAGGWETERSTLLGGWDLGGVPQTFGASSAGGASPEEKIAEEVSGKQQGGRKQRVSSLQRLVSWYREHSASCPHEPELRALEPKPDCSTAAVWQCVSDHSFVQYLYSPLQEVSGSEHEERGSGDSDGEAANKTDPLSAKGTGARQRRKEDELIDTINQPEEDGGQNDQPRIETSSQDTTLVGPPAWDTESLHSASAEEEEAAALEDVGQGTDEEGEKEKLREEEEEMRTFGPDYECNTTAAPLPDELDRGNEGSQNLNGSVPLSAQMELSVPPAVQVQERAELFDPQSLQTVVTGCEIPNQRTALEGSQLIIITGPSYEALASEGVQLNMGSGNMEEVTCTVIGGVTYSQLCTPDFKVRSAQEEDSLTGSKYFQ